MSTLLDDLKRARSTANDETAWILRRQDAVASLATLLHDHVDEIIALVESATEKDWHDHRYGPMMTGKYDGCPICAALRPFLEERP